MGDNGEFAIGFFNLQLGCRGRHTQDIVVGGVSDHGGCNRDESSHQEMFQSEINREQGKQKDRVWMRYFFFFHPDAFGSSLPLCILFRHGGVSLSPVL